jgi:nitrogen-specific signal transduction histidine kinase
MGLYGSLRAVTSKRLRLPGMPTNAWRDIVDSLGDAIVVLSADLEPATFNPAAETLLAISKPTKAFVDELLARNEWLSRMVHECLTKGQTLSDPEAELTMSRRSIVVRAEASPLMKPDGQIRGAVVLLQDLSHQKIAERALEAGGTGLRLSPAGLAHEVKNPLTGIKGAGELLATMFPGDPRVQDYCTVILEGVERITTLVEQVLAFSSPQRLSMRPANIHRILHQALKMAGLFPLAPDGIAVEQQFDPSLPEVTGDIAALEGVFLNLIRNAIEAIRSRGRIRLSTRMEAPFQMTAGGKRRSFLRVEVADSGVGITEADFSQLFTPFFTTKPQGTGLGLVISQRIVSLHGGKLWAERGGTPADNGRGAGADSESGSAQAAEVPGMTFKVTLPINIGSPKD